jgi:hypothetical protein
MAVTSTNEPNERDLTLVDLIRRDHGVAVNPTIARFTTAGWTAQIGAPVGCADCGNSGRPVYRKPYTTRRWGISGRAPHGAEA